VHLVGFIIRNTGICIIRWKAAARKWCAMDSIFLVADKQSASRLPLYCTCFWRSKIYYAFLSGEAAAVRTVWLSWRLCLCSLFTIVKFWIIFLPPISEQPQLGIDFSILVIERLVKTTAILTCICNAPGSNIGRHTPIFQLAFLSLSMELPGR
jgi:hypothetical protein